MAKITRATQKIFGTNAATADVGQFGSESAGSPVETKDPATIMALAQYLTGWRAATPGNAPYIQDMNSLFLMITSQLAYLCQQGIAEYDALTTYYIGSLVKKADSQAIYVSLTDDNLGNALTDGTNWLALSVDVYNFYVKYPYAEAAGTIQQQLLAYAGNIVSISAVLGTDATGQNFIANILNNGNVVKKSTDTYTFADISNTLTEKTDADTNIAVTANTPLSLSIQQTGSTIIGQDLMIQVKILRT